MDNIMSSYSFSPQFYQHWTQAPESIRAAIVQELTDITTLLQTETPFESFTFSTHDLDTHIDDLYDAHEKQQVVAKDIAEKQAQARATAEKERLEEEKQKIKAADDAKLKEDAKLKAEAESAQKERQSSELLAADKNNVNNKVATNDFSQTNTNHNIANNSTNDATNDASKNIVAEKPDAAKNDAVRDTPSNNNNSIKNDNSIKAINDTIGSSLPIDLALKDVALNAEHKELLSELERQIDDYVSEQMMQMSENLQSWLRAELSQRLSGQNPVEPKVDGNK